MSYIVVDVESDGPIPPQYSMVCFGAVIVEPSFSKTFFGRTKPISKEWQESTLAISGISREEHETFNDPTEVMQKFKEWIAKTSKGKPIFISDNPAYDWQWINWYFHTFIGQNPFGFSAQRIGDKFQGFYNDPYYKWKRHRNNDKFPHNHDPVSDACGNASALLYLQSQGFKIDLK